MARNVCSIAAARGGVLGGIHGSNAGTATDGVARRSNEGDNVTRTPRIELDYPFAALPEPGTAMEVAPGVHWVRMPLPFKLDHINLYLLDDGDGWTIVDTGYGNDVTKELWREVWRTALGGRPVTRLIVTHFHPDHVGNAGWLADTIGVMPHMTQVEWLSAGLAFRIAGTADLDRRIPWYVRNGLSPERVEFFRAGNVPYPNGVTLPPSYIRIRGGDCIDAGGRPWRKRS